MDPKLIEARAEIEAILKRLDIAGHVVLHNAPGQLEVFSHLSPSYSCMRPTDDGVRLRSRLQEDHGGDVEQQRRVLTSTLNMVHGIGETLATNGLFLLELSESVDELVGATHTPLERTEGRPQ